MNKFVAQRLGITVSQVRTLKRKCEEAATAQEREHNEQNAPSSQEKTAAVENYAKSLGYGTIWPGLYPVLTKDGQQFHIY
jgi:hypothetical protein